VLPRPLFLVLSENPKLSYSAHKKLVALQIEKLESLFSYQEVLFFSTRLNCTFAMTHMLFPVLKLKLNKSTCLNLQEALQICNASPSRG
jgi:hypothetical protein